jgi:hypothetical protein
MDTPTSKTPVKTDHFEWLSEEISREQEFYWTRFTAFATLHAGLLVLITSDALKRPHILAGVAIALGVIWFYIQLASLHYVNRLKPLFRAAREARGIDYLPHRVFSRRFLSTTDVALVVPFGLTVLWIVFPFT